MFEAKGYYKSRGTQTATHTIAKQVDGIAQAFPEIRKYYLSGTINIRFEPKILVAGSDHRTPQIFWTGQDTGEVFDLVRVSLAIDGRAEEVPALMYVAHWSPHRNDPHKHEFIADRFIENLRDDMPIVVHCARNSIELPYLSEQSGGNGRPRLARTFVIM